MALKRPSQTGLPPRRSDNDKRRLAGVPSPEQLDRLAHTATYAGSSKHKLHPHLYGLLPYNGDRGDATLCDRDAGFQPADMERIPRLMRRGINAGLVDDVGRIIWSVADDGSMFEFRLTNAVRSEYHGYPLRPTESIAALVFRRFDRWARRNGTVADRGAAATCRLKHGFRHA